MLWGGAGRVAFVLSLILECYARDNQGYRNDQGFNTGHDTSIAIDKITKGSYPDSSYVVGHGKDFIEGNGQGNDHVNTKVRYQESSANQDTYENLTPQTKRGNEKNIPENQRSNQNQQSAKYNGVKSASDNYIIKAHDGHVAIGSITSGVFGSDTFSVGAPGRGVGGGQGDTFSFDQDETGSSNPHASQNENRPLYSHPSVPLASPNENNTENILGQSTKTPQETKLPKTETQNVGGVNKYSDTQTNISNKEIFSHHPTPSDIQHPTALSDNDNNKPAVSYPPIQSFAEQLPPDNYHKDSGTQITENQNATNAENESTDTSETFNVPNLQVPYDSQDPNNIENDGSPEHDTNLQDPVQNQNAFSQEPYLGSDTNEQASPNIFEPTESYNSPPPDSEDQNIQQHPNGFQEAEQSWTGQQDLQNQNVYTGTGPSPPHYHDWHLPGYYQTQNPYVPYPSSSWVNTQFSPYTNAAAPFDSKYHYPGWHNSPLVKDSNIFQPNYNEYPKQSPKLQAPTAQQQDDCPCQRRYTPVQWPYALQVINLLPQWNYIPPIQNYPSPWPYTSQWHNINRQWYYYPQNYYYFLPLPYFQGQLK